MLWNNHSRDVPDGAHSFLSPSQHAWFNYDDDKLIQVYLNKLASVKGTKMHALAAQLIEMKVRLPEVKTTFNMYVNDAIDLKMEPEKKLYYSKFCFGTADTILVKDGLLEIHDLKTGKTKVNFLQLEIYAALFFLEYTQYKPGKMDVVLRIYQNGEILEKKPETDEIVPVMDKIIRHSRILESLEDEYDGTT